MDWQANYAILSGRSDPITRGVQVSRLGGGIRSRSARFLPTAPFRRGDGQVSELLHFPAIPAVLYRIVESLDFLWPVTHRFRTFIL